MQNTFEVNINHRAFNAIKIGQKKVEIRANKDNGRVDYKKLKKGDFLSFFSEFDKSCLLCVVEKKKLYHSVQELLINEGTEHTLSSTNNIEEGIKSIESIKDYKEIIPRNGVFAIHIRLK